MAGEIDKELKKWIDLYMKLPDEGRIIIFSNASALLASEEMRKQQNAHSIISRKK